MPYFNPNQYQIKPLPTLAGLQGQVGNNVAPSGNINPPPNLTPQQQQQYQQYQQQQQSQAQPQASSGITYNQWNGQQEKPAGWNYIPGSWETGPDAGRLWNPIPAPGTTAGWAFRTRQIPGEAYKGYVDYNSRSWQLARQVTFSDPASQQVWSSVLPDAWKATMAGWEPETRNAWVMGFVRGDDAMMQAATKNQQQYGQQQQRAEQQAQYNAQHQAPTPNAQASYFVPSPWL